ncbi:MAG: hypothetical protein KF763_01655 [Cyclobacteriaceae bacterium]|nr:hypothetical protein [Cyclobacteriaceae bacterium]
MIARFFVALLTAIVLFHILVLAGVVPMEIVWGGRITTRTELVQFEVVSIMINLIMIFVVSHPAGFIQVLKPVVVRWLLAVMAILFALNTIGNVMAVDPLERWIFTPLTALMCVLSVLLLRKH